MTKTTWPGKKWNLPHADLMGYAVYFDVREDMGCIYTVFDVQSGTPKVFQTDWGYRPMARVKAEIMHYILELE